MCEIDPYTGVATPYGATNEAWSLGALFFDSFENLYAYGQKQSDVGGHRRFYSIDLSTGVITEMATGPNSLSNDGCSCAHGVEIFQSIDRTLICGADTVTYTIDISNQTGTALSDIEYQCRLVKL